MRGLSRELLDVTQPRGSDSHCLFKVAPGGHRPARRPQDRCGKPQGRIKLVYGNPIR